MKFSKFIVLFVIAINIVFTGLVLYIFRRTGSEPSTLITSWFAFTTGELLALAAIKRGEVKHGRDRDDDEH